MESESALLKVINSNTKFQGVELDDFHFDVKKSRKGADKKREMRHTIYRGVFNIQEVADYLRVGRNAVYKLIYSNELPSFKIGGRRLVAREELNHFIKNAQCEARELVMKGEI